LNSNEFDDLIQDIENTTIKTISVAQLVCITRLVYFSGIQQQEVPELRVLDVIDSSGNVKASIKKGSKPIILRQQAQAAIIAYLDGIRKRNPSLAMKRKPLFPAYKNTKKLQRDWAKFYTYYREIHKSGIKHHFLKRSKTGMPKMKIYEEGAEIFRITPRQYYARAEDKERPSGQYINDQKCMSILWKALERAESIDRKSPSAKKIADDILRDARAAVAKTQSSTSRQQHSYLFKTIIEKLK
jgi:hypothetical protein